MARLYMDPLDDPFAEVNGREVARQLAAAESELPLPDAQPPLPATAAERDEASSR